MWPYAWPSRTIFIMLEHGIFKASCCCPHMYALGSFHAHRDASEVHLCIFTQLIRCGMHAFTQQMQFTLAFVC